MAKMKPKMPEEPIEFSATTKAHLMLDMENYSSGHLGMGLEQATIRQGKVELGKVDLCMGGGVIVHIGKRTWGLDPVDLYNIAKQAEVYARKLKARPL